jgi:hypothetical protein
LPAALLPIFKGSFVPWLLSAAPLFLKVLWRFLRTFARRPAAHFLRFFCTFVRRRRHHHQGSLEPLPAALLPIFKGSFVPLSPPPPSSSRFFGTFARRPAAHF